MPKAEALVEFHQSMRMDQASGKKIITSCCNGRSFTFVSTGFLESNFEALIALQK
jgi:hypothetical protein